MILSTLKFIITHPLNKGKELNSIINFIKWQIIASFLKYPIVYNFTTKSKLIIKKGMTGATGNLYCGLFDYQEMLFLLHFLRSTDTFYDIGANVGCYSVLASAHVGAKTYAFEPVPSTFIHLQNNIYLNNLNNVRLFNMALGSKKGDINFTTTNDTTNHVATTNDVDVINVKIDLLDNLINKTDVPILIKIDVEGYETEVINGASKSLTDKNLKAIIIELNGSGRRYNYDESLIHKQLLIAGFAPFLYDPQKRLLKKVDKFGSYNTIYIRDFDFVSDRIKNASKVRISEKEY